MQTTNNIQTVVRNKTILNNTPFLITKDGEGFYKQDGQLIPYKVFEALYPTQIVFTNLKGFNKDRTKIS